MTAELQSTSHGQTLVLTLRAPQARNALDGAICAAGIEALSVAERSDEVRCVVITGADGVSSAETSLERLQASRQQPAQAQAQGVELLHHWVEAVRTHPKPVIAAVEGMAEGAGFSLALACDLIVAADNAQFLTAYVRVGLTADGGASASLARALPPQLYAELMLTGGPVDAARLHAAGVVNRVTAPGRALDEAAAWAQTIAEGPAGAMGRAKKLMELAYGSFATQLARESDLFVEALHHGEAKEGITAFFEKRRPVFHKR